MAFAYSFCIFNQSSKQDWFGKYKNQLSITTKNNSNNNNKQTDRQTGTNKQTNKQTVENYNCLLTSTVNPCNTKSVGKYALTYQPTAYKTIQADNLYRKTNLVQVKAAQMSSLMTPQKLILLVTK